MKSSLCRVWKASLPLPQLLKLGITQLGQVTDPGLSAQQLMKSKKMLVAKTENKKVPKIFMSPGCFFQNLGK